jgi:recombination protein RecA
MAKGEDKVLSETDAWKQLEDLFGGDSIVRPDEVVKTDFIRSGTPSLDRAIGVGGWPRGRLIQLAGAPSSGKTLMALIAIANWQKEHPDNCAAFLDAEFTYSPEWAAKFGVDNDRIYLVKNNEAAKLFTGLVGKVKKHPVTGKITKIAGLFDMIESGQQITYVHPVTKKKLTLDCGRMGVIVLDSIANIQVPQEVEADTGKALVAPIARFLTTELKKLTPGIAKANVCMIGINQVRVEVGKMFGDPECVDPFSTVVKIRYKV